MSNSNIYFVSPSVGGGIDDYTALIVEAMGSTARISNIRETSQVKDCLVVLQYSGYGFAKRGAPLHLLPWVKQVKANNNVIGVYFHEVSASGPINSSAFWLSSAQKYIAKTLANTSDFWITNITQTFDWLRNCSSTEKGTLIPTPSTIGEHVGLQPIRSDTAILFGGAALRAKTYQKHFDAITSFAKGNSVTILDIGPRLPLELERRIAEATPMQFLGRLDADAVRTQLAAARFGLIGYPSSHIGKSSVHAAYCAHGVCPILFDDSPDSDKSLALSAGPVYHDARTTVVSKTQEVSVARHAREWYQGHSLSVHVDAYRQYTTAAGAR